MSSALGVRLMGGSSGRVRGLGNKCLHRVLHFSLCVMAGGVLFPVWMGGDAKVLLHLVQLLICQTFCAFTSDAIFW